MKKRLLLVEDDPNLGFVTKDNLEQKGFEVELAVNGELGYEAFLKKKYDLCVFDIMMPLKDGFTLAEDIRKTDQTTPILFLTAKSLDEDKVKGFKIGGDDYLTKPFNMEELVLRIEAILKRSTSSKNSSKVIYEIGKYMFDYKNLSLVLNDQTKGLTKKEAELLNLLCIHKDNVLERELALKVVWGEDDYFLGRSMDVFIAKLRKYLKDDPAIKIANVHGVGFKLEIN